MDEDYRKLVKDIKELKEKYKDDKKLAELLNKLDYLDTEVTYLKN